VVAQAQISVFALEGSREQIERIASANPQRKALAQSSSDEKGAFTIDPGKESVIDLQVEAAGFAPSFTTIESNETGLTIALTPAEAKPGIVRLNGKPLAGALIVLTARGSEFQALPSSLLLRSGSDGKFEVADPALWAGSIFVRSPEAAPLSRTFDPKTKRVDLDFNLLPGVSVSGSVVDAKGKPAAGATMFVDGWPSGVTREDGSFALTHVASDYKVLAAANATAAGQASSKQKPITIKLSADRMITGTVRDAQRKPIASARIIVPLYSSDDGARSVLTGSDGRFSMPRLAAEKVSLWAMRPGYNMVAAGDSDLRVASSADTQISMTRESRISGMVLDEARHPVSGAFVMLSLKQAPAVYFFGGSALGSVGTYALPDGSFSLRVPEAYLAVREGVPADMY
jgi:hypothetical protein